MTLDEAIQHAQWVADNAPGCECGKEHAQLAAWLRELKNLRAKMNAGLRVAEMEQTCKRCGHTFYGKGCAKLCPDCRRASWTENARRNNLTGKMRAAKLRKRMEGADEDAEN